jgi:O-methyltransferase involved in polyketide biosynthesis
MAETTNPNLSDVAGTSLITLYLRAVESQRPDAPTSADRQATAQSWRANMASRR